MKTADFEYHSPRTIHDATSLLAALSDQDARILAGGQSLVPAMAFRLAQPRHLIDINGIEALDALGVADENLVIGACVRHAAFHRSVVDGALGDILSHVAHHIAHYPIRSRGTFCGSLAHADPASEWCLVAATLEASMVAASVRGDRVIAAEDFFVGLMTTALEDDEILKEVRIPLPAAGTVYGFYEFNRRAGDFAIAAALTAGRLVDGKMTSVRVGLGGVEACARHIPEAAAILEGASPSEEVFKAAAQAAADAVDPLEDQQADAIYRRDLTRTVICRALRQSFGGHLSGRI
jgi:carbon-monoxide dehydrogenase medium subunit